MSPLICPSDSFFYTHGQLVNSFIIPSVVRETRFIFTIKTEKPLMLRIWVPSIISVLSVRMLFLFLITVYTAILFLVQILSMYRF